MPNNDAPPDPPALPWLLLALTMVTGLVDAVSFLSLGSVFVANMTGNVVFLGFAAAGAQAVSAPASLTAVGAFLLGSAAGGALARREWPHRTRLLGVTTAIGAGLVAVATVVAGLAGAKPAGSFLYAVIGLLAVAMGLQNAMARRLAVPDLTTTVLTLTITGLTSDLPWRRGSGARQARRVAAVVTMFTGAVVGGALTLNAQPAAALAVAFLLLAATALVALVTTRSAAGGRRAAHTGSA